MRAHVINTPLGWIAAAYSGKGLAALTLPMPTKDKALIDLQKTVKDFLVVGYEFSRPLYRVQREYQPVCMLAESLYDYFIGNTPDFACIALDTSQCTSFAKKVYSKVAQVPYGQTRSYGWVAHEIGANNGARAVGGILRNNPFPIVVPCHRIISASGKIGGFTGGLDLKRRLLAIEGFSI